MQTLEVVTGIILMIGSVYFGALGFIKSIQRFSFQVNKLSYTKAVPVYFSISSLLFFLCAEIYLKTLVCLPFLLFAILIFWLDYLIYETVMRSKK